MHNLSGQPALPPDWPRDEKFYTQSETFLFQFMPLSVIFTPCTSVQSLSDLPIGTTRLPLGAPKLSLLQVEQTQLSQLLLAGQVLDHPGRPPLSSFQFINVFPVLEAAKVF